MNVQSLDFEKGNGLLPAVVQDHKSYQVLMVGYMNKEAVEKTLTIGKVTFYSRSKERLWTKGETSENYLEVVDIQSDCDDDTLLILAKPHGPTCHTGNTSCFYEKDFKADNPLAFLLKLEKLLQDRKKELPEGSYTSSLFKKGLDKITQKVGEEAVETVIASKNEDDSEFVYEASDLLFHLMMLLTEKDYSLKDLVEELESRHG